MSEVTTDNQALLCEHVYSMEYYQLHEEQPIQILRDISLDIKLGEIWGIIGESAFELRLLLEIIANARPYEKGTCRLANKGMLRKKRTILPHVYYIGSTNMLFDNMNVLEYLMFVTAKDKSDPINRQDYLFQTLLDLQLGYLSLSAIHDLTPSERAVITLVVALISDSRIIVWNIARLSYDERSKQALKQISLEIRKQKKALIFSTFDFLLLEEIATHIAGLDQGHIKYQGEVKDFITTWDHLTLVIEDERANLIEQVLKVEMQAIELHRRGAVIEIWDATHDENLYDRVFQTLCTKGIYPYKIYQHEHNVENAWKEVRIHDL